MIFMATKGTRERTEITRNPKHDRSTKQAYVVGRGLSVERESCHLRDKISLIGKRSFTIDFFSFLFLSMDFVHC